MPAIADSISPAGLARLLEAKNSAALADKPVDRGVELAVQTSLTEAVRDALTGRRMSIQLITPGWGTSGYYSESVLKQAARDKVFPAGTQMYIDHQTFSEAADREHGERSLKDLAARFTSDARWDGGALTAEVEVTNPTWRPVIKDMRDHVGVSIRALGEADNGEAAGREGPIIKRINRAMSVDFVAEAGRGGRVLALLESTRSGELAEARNIGAWFEARLHTMFTEIADGMYGEGRLTREERIALSSGIGDALGAFVQRVEADQPQLYKRDIYGDPDSETAVQESSDDATPAADEQPATETATPEPETTGETEAAESATQDVPTDQAAQGTPTPLQEGDADMAEENISPGTARQLMERELAEARRERDAVKAREHARRVLAEALNDAWIPPATVTRITESLLERLPITSGALDETELVKMAGREAERAEREMAEALEAAGMGRPRDLGFGTDAGNQAMGLGQAELDRRLTESFKGLGLTDKQAALAARGRD